MPKTRAIEFAERAALARSRRVLPATALAWTAALRIVATGDLAFWGTLWSVRDDSSARSRSALSSAGDGPVRGWRVGVLLRGLDDALECPAAATATASSGST